MIPNLIDNTYKIAEIVLACLGAISFVIKPAAHFFSVIFSPVDYSLIIVEDGKDEVGKIQKICIRLNNYSKNDLSIKEIKWNSQYLQKDDIDWPINKDKNSIIKGCLLKSGADGIWPLIKWYPEKQHDFVNLKALEEIKVFYKFGFFTYKKNYKTDALYEISKSKSKEISDGFFHKVKESV